MKLKKIIGKFNKKLFFTVDFFNDLVNKIFISIYYSIKLYLKRKRYKSPSFPIHKKFEKIEFFFDHLGKIVVPFLEIIFHVKKKSFTYNDYINAFNMTKEKQNIFFFILWCICYPFRPLSALLHNFLFNLIYGKKIQKKSK